MATYLVGGALALVLGLIIAKMVRDKKKGKGACSCGGDCSKCHAACAHHD